MTWAVFTELKLPLSRALLSDPAFSADPRTHPHFPLASAASFKQPPSKPPVLSSDVPHPSTRTPRQCPPPLKRAALLSSKTINIPRKPAMKTLVRRLTSRHNLDRIDELDETDPFGGSYHHDGPYEAISTNHIHGNPAPRSIRPPKPEFNPHSLYLVQHKSLLQAPPAHSDQGFALHLEPGQILQHNTVYASHASTPPLVPSHPTRQSNALAIRPQPDHVRTHSLPNHRVHPLEDPFNKPSSFPRAPLQRYLVDNTPDLPDARPLYHGRDAAPYDPMPAFPPPRFESRLHISDSSPPPSKPTSQTTDTHHPRRKSGDSLDNSHTINTTIPQSSSSLHNDTLEPPWVLHLPRHLVMPAPLQPQVPEPRYNFPLGESVIWHEYPDDRALESVGFEEQSAMYAQSARPPQKRSSALSRKTLILPHVSILQDDAEQIMGSTSTQTANESEGIKQKTRRRRLSKRKNDS